MLFELIAGQLTQTFAYTAQLAPQFRGLFARLGPAVAASKRGLPAFDQILGKLPPLLNAFGPFLRNANPVFRYGSAYSNPRSQVSSATSPAPAREATTSPPTPPAKPSTTCEREQTLTPSSLAFYPHALGIDRGDAYRLPGAYSQLSSGLATLDTELCAEGVPSAPTSATGSIPITPTPGTTYDPTLAQLIGQQAYRNTSGGSVAAPACKSQGTVPGFSTSFPQLKADPPPSVTGR